ncbi:alpha/beta fold hydrolase [Cohnella terricola]|uniref:Alpha/beta hydrolase n=1 Tax=Cohnella terricola TaxID=1289167 RepID=A0A559JQT2_9BACL|nr:alpha/beta hydrolase [Cohnella terricola]TVY02223.1 alpha/beta hydrolase [Cohnella terricola]
MAIQSRFAKNGEVAVHYLISHEESSSVPLLICPGLSETAEEYADLMAYLSPRKCIALSFRGRGQSGTPESGYDLEHHVADIRAVVDHADLNRFHLYANSRGVSYAIGYSEKYPSGIMSMIMQDYPAEHKAMATEWPEEYILQYLVPFSRQRNIRPEAVRGIGKESTPIRFGKKTNKRLLVLRGRLEDSLLNDEELKCYSQLSDDLRAVTFERSGHDIRNTEKSLLYRTIGDFIQLT